MLAPKAQVYEFGPFRLDSVRRLLFRNHDQPLPLTPKAFDALLYLLQHPDELLEKDELMAAIWPGRVIEENNLNQVMSTLRRILGESLAAHRYIVTVPGRGYRFVAEVRVSPAFAAVSEASPKQIAILPFLPLVKEHRDPALELGMADTLIARLSSIRRLVVRPISAVRKYAHQDQDPLAAGRELEVHSVLEGSIQRQGNTIRVTARLIEVASGTALWAETFDQQFSDIFAVQDALAARLASALVPQLGAEEKSQLYSRQTDNAEVYELYLTGRYHLFRLTPPEMQTAVEYFQRAIAIEPGYAPAHIGLASAQFRLPLAGELNPRMYYPKAQASAQRALQIDDAIAEAHAILGWIAFWYDWNWSASEHHFKQAQRLDPNNLEAHLGYAHLLSNTGRHQEALVEVVRAKRIDPLLLLPKALESLFLLSSGQAEVALVKLQETLALEPKFWMTHLFFSSVFFEMGRYSEALDAAVQAAELASGNTHARAAAACALAKLGRHDESRRVLDELLMLAQHRYVPPYHFALLYNGLGESAQAIAWLRRGLVEKDPKLTFLLTDPKLNNLRTNASFIELVHRVGLPLAAPRQDI